METCKICSNKEGNKVFTVREMQFGTKVPFQYMECKVCKCIQLLTSLKDISEFYPGNYGAHQIKPFQNQSFLKRWIKLQKSKYILGQKKNITGYILKQLFGSGFVEKLKPAGIKMSDKILDVGSGIGGRLIDLNRRGFTNLTGIDPFIEKDYIYNDNLRILKKDIFELHDSFDFIMLNHSFEHMDEPFTVFKQLYKLLKTGKSLLIRIPVSNCYAWGKYQENWVALDAPRHYFLHNDNTIKIIAEKTGFILKKVIYDSTSYQFLGSEQFLNNISVVSDKSYFTNPAKSMFNNKDLRYFTNKAQELNKIGTGDAACFYLVKPN